MILKINDNTIICRFNSTDLYDIMYPKYLGRRYQMGKDRTIKIVLLLIIVLFVFQLIPSNLNYDEDSQSHTQSTEVFIKSGSINTDILLIGKLNQKEAFQKLLIKSPSTVVNRTFVVDVFSNYSFFKEDPFDHRKVIRQSIPHYFNGTKYKSQTFDI